MKGSLTCVGHVPLECVSRAVSGKKGTHLEWEEEVLVEWWRSKLQDQHSMHYTSPDLVGQRAERKSLKNLVFTCPDPISASRGVLSDATKT